MAIFQVAMDVELEASVSAESSSLQLTSLDALMLELGDSVANTVRSILRHSFEALCLHLF
jgi:hypothetical protein